MQIIYLKVFNNIYKPLRTKGEKNYRYKEKKGRRKTQKV
jgi:hypothetical protein